MAAFAQKLGSMCYTSCVGFVMSLAKNSGIMQTLMDAQKPMTSQEIADEKGLKERYVREILDCITTAGLLHATRNEADTLVYHLEDEEKQCLKSPLLPFMGFSGMFSSIYHQVSACLPKDGPFGARYSDGVHDLLDEVSGYMLDGYVEKILASVDGLKNKLENGIQVIEFGCGSGRLLAKFATMFLKSTFVASDVVPALITKLKTKWGHIPNIHYELHDLCSLTDPPAKQYDWVFTVDVIHDLPKPLDALKAIHKVVKKPEGIFTFIDMATAGNPIDDGNNLEIACYYAASTFLCIPESFQREDSAALGSCWGKQTAINLATSAGFKVNVAKMDGSQALYMCQP